MVDRTMWSQELDEDLPGGAAPAAAEHPDPGGPGDAGTAAVPDPADPAPYDEDETGARGGSAFTWLAALAGVALLLLLVGWLLNHDSGGLAAQGPNAGAPAVLVPAADGTVPPGATAANGGPLLGGLAAGTTSGTTSGTSAGSTAGQGGSAAGGGTGGASGSGATGASGGTAPGTQPGAGGGGSGGGNGGSGASTGSGVKAGVDVKVGASGVDAGVDLGVATAPGGAVTSVVVTACAKVSDLNPKLDAEAKVVWANGYEATGVKLTGLTLLNLLDPGTVKVTTGGTSYAIPAGVGVKVGLCLGL